ncbi:MAG: hypothetical protein HY556_10570 [Euryarchaeota archaeon]|nr:hypothetical protein [Euryarchaeota archaeon]
MMGSGLSTTSIIAKLVMFGLDQREAKAFHELSRMGVCTGSELARASGLSRTEIYPVLASLENRGLVTRTLERPTRFQPIAIEAALERLVDTKKAEFKALEAASETLHQHWPRQATLAAPTNERFAVFRGPKQIHGILERMLDSAREEILFVTTRRGVSRFEAAGIWEGLVSKARTGIVVKGLMNIENASQAPENLELASLMIRHLNVAGHHQMLIVDGRELVMFISAPSQFSTTSSGEAVLWLNSIDFILAQKVLFDAHWAVSMEATARTRELESGEAAEQVGVVRGRWARYNKMKEMVYRAKKEVIFVTDGGNWARDVKAGIVKLLSTRAGAGVRTRVLATRKPGSPGAGLEVRSIPQILPFNGVVIDATEMLVVLGADEDPDAMASENEWSVLVSRRKDVTLALAHLETLWAMGK